MVDANVAGYVDFEPESRKVKQLKLTTKRATHRDRPVDVGVESPR